MTDAVLIEIAKAVAAELQSGSDAGSFARTFDAERSYADFAMELTELDMLKVDVVPVTYRVIQESQGSMNYECDVDVGIRKRFSDSENGNDGRVLLDEVDQLVLLYQQVERYFEPTSSSNGRRLSTVTDAAWQKTELRAVYVPVDFFTARQYTGIVRFTFEVPRAAS